jgi:hypothetical protein
MKIEIERFGDTYKVTLKDSVNPFKTTRSSIGAARASAKRLQDMLKVKTEIVEV